MEVVNKYGADALRLYLINSPVVSWQAPAGRRQVAGASRQPPGQAGPGPLFADMAALLACLHLLLPSPARPPPIPPYFPSR